MRPQFDARDTEILRERQRLLDERPGFRVGDFATEQTGTEAKKKSTKKSAAKKAAPKKEGPRPNPSKGIKGRTNTVVGDSADLVARYAKRRGWSETQARDYLIYVGFNRRAALEKWHKENAD